MLYRPLGPGRGAGCPGWGCVVMARCRGGLGPTRGSGVLVHTGLHLFVCNIIITYQITCPCPSIITSSKTGNHCFFFTIRPQLSLVCLWYFVILITAFLPNPLAPCKFDGDKARRMSACPMSLSLPRVQWLWPPQCWCEGATTATAPPHHTSPADQLPSNTADQEDFYPHTSYHLQTHSPAELMIHHGKQTSIKPPHIASTCCSDPQTSD